MTGVVRRKPGKGEPTLSTSCSDKIAKWSLLGMQGALLGSLLGGPLYFHGLVVGAPGSGEGAPAAERASIVQTAEAALHRAFNERTQPLRARLEGTPFAAPLPRLASLVLDPEELHALGLSPGGHPERRVPCGTSLLWWAPVSSSWRLRRAKSDPSRGNREHMTIIGGTLEAVVGKSGTKAGKGHVGPAPVPLPQQSQLCRAALTRRYIDAVAVVGGVRCIDSEGEGSDWLKERVSRQYVDVWRRLRDPPSPLEGWIAKTVEPAPLKA